jgi:hypothetical protein
MNLIIRNVGKTLRQQSLDPSDNTQIEAITDKLMSIFPSLNGWSYDSELDIMYVEFLVTISSRITEIGEVDTGDFIIW